MTRGNSGKAIRTRRGSKAQARSFTSDIGVDSTVTVHGFAGVRHEVERYEPLARDGYVTVDLHRLNVDISFGLTIEDAERLHKELAEKIERAKVRIPCNVISQCSLCNINSEKKP